MQTEYTLKYRPFEATSQKNDVKVTISNSKIVLEPPLQRKKRVNNNTFASSVFPLTTRDNNSDMSRSQNELNKLENVIKEEKNDLKRSLSSSNINSIEPEIILLGPQQKLCTKNIQYKIRNPLNLSVDSLIKPIESGQQESKTKTIKDAPFVKINVKNEISENKSNEVPKQRFPMSEYQKSFAWALPKEIEKLYEEANKLVEEQLKKPEVQKVDEKKVNKEEPKVEEVKAKKEQSIKKIDEPKKQQKEVIKHGNFPMRQSEYKANFKAPKKEEKKKAKVEEVKSAPQVSVPQVLLNNHGKLKKWKSEYSLQYGSYWNENQRNEKSDESTKLNDQTSSEWFKNIIELRQKVAEYKQRTNGLNFSRDHLAQLNGNNLKLWDMPTEESPKQNPKEENKEPTNEENNAKKNELQINQKETSIKEAKDKKDVKVKQKKKEPEVEVSIKAEKVKDKKQKHKNKKRSKSIESKKSEETKKEAQENQQQQETLNDTNSLTKRKQELLNEIIKLYHNRNVLPNYRLREQLDSSQLKKHLNWNTAESNQKQSPVDQLSARSLELSVDLLERAKQNSNKHWGTKVSNNYITINTK